MFHGGSKLLNFENSRKNLKIPNMPISLPKLSKRVLNLFWGSFFEKNFSPVFHGGSSLRKFSKKIKKISKFQPKTHKTVPKRIQKCFEHVLGQIFRKVLAQFSTEGRVFENFQKNQKNSKFQKCQKSFPKVSKRVLYVFWGNFFEKFYAQCSMEARDF